MTGHVTLSEALEVVQRAAEADPALRSMIFARLGATDPTRPANDAPVRLPPIEAMNAVQAAVFDNWPSDRRVTGRPNRYGMAIEIWTAPPERINVARRGNYQHKVNVALMDAKAIKAWVKTVEKTNAKRLNPLSVDFLAGLAEAATIMGPGEFLGVCAVKTPGAGHVYFDHQWVHVRLDGEAALVHRRARVDVVDPQAVYDWIEAMDDKPTLVRMPETGHFFHRRMMDLRGAIKNGVRANLPPA